MINLTNELDMKHEWVAWYNYYCQRSYTLAMYSGLAEEAFFAGWKAARGTLWEEEVDEASS